MDTQTITDALYNKYSWLTSVVGWYRLHYIPGVTYDDWDNWWEDDNADHEVIAICGTRFIATLPGIFSRMGLPRCAHCCDKLTIPRGNGAALNDKTLDPMRTNYVDPRPAWNADRAE